MLELLDIEKILTQKPPKNSNPACFLKKKIIFD